MLNEASHRSGDTTIFHNRASKRCYGIRRMRGCFCWGRNLSKAQILKFMARTSQTGQAASQKPTAFRCSRARSAWNARNSCRPRENCIPVLPLHNYSSCAPAKPHLLTRTFSLLQINRKPSAFVPCPPRLRKLERSSPLAPKAGEGLDLTRPRPH